MEVYALLSVLVSSLTILSCSITYMTHGSLDNSKIREMGNYKMAIYSAIYTFFTSSHLLNASSL